MKKILIIIFQVLAITLSLTSCSEIHTPVKTEKANDYAISHLFTYDGCKVYRFIDGNRYRYFTNCTETIYDNNESAEKAIIPESIKNVR